MPEWTNAQLIAGLEAGMIESPDPFFAAGELGDRGDPSSVGPLCKALARLTFEDSSEYGLADVMVRALGQLGDARAADAIIETLQKTAGHDFVPPAACEARVRLRATQVVPALEALIRDRHHAEDIDVLAPALVALGGAVVAPLFVELLATRHEGTNVAAATALGALGNLAAAPSLKKLVASRNEYVRLAALAALVAMDAPCADADLRARVARASSWLEKSSLLRLIRKHAVTRIAGLLLEKIVDPIWTDSEFVLCMTLDVAAFLGAAETVAMLRTIAAGAVRSPCTRACAAASLLDHDDEALVGAALDFLRRNGCHAEKDARDPWVRCEATQETVIAALEGFASGHPGELLPIVDCLDARRSGS